MSAHRNHVGWFEIYVQDMERARKFYEHTFQTTLTHLPSPELEMWMFPSEMEKPGCGGVLAKMEGKDSGVGGTIVYFVCEDCAVEAERAVAQGGRIHRAKSAVGDYGFIVLLLDPDGNMIGLHSMA